MRRKNTTNQRARVTIISVTVLVPAYVASIFLFAISSDELTSDDLNLLLVSVLLGILPFANAIVDWLSLCFTRGLLFKLQHSNHAWYKSVGFVVVDVLLALCFIAVVTATTLGVLGGLNSISGKVFIDFNQLMINVTLPEKLTDNLWLHLMLFSTILPTLIHLGFALYALLLGYWRPNLAAWIDDLPRASGPEREKAYFYTLRTRVWAFIGVLIIAYGFYLLLETWQTPLWWLWSWADTVLNVVDSTYQTPLNVKPEL